ncbi:MAG TPA: bifunctional diguanylate cyclase/phosphodiesterase [Mycobacteriales bacterium]|nr:bifunctional diguanylate cyclase/phosphodiesterase [Mycobacteriales bacterium]
MSTEEPARESLETQRLRRRVDRERRARLEAEKIAERFTRAAHHDPLTGLANRTHMLDRLRAALARDPQRCGHVGLLFLDLDAFKQVNDRYGHQVGDAYLQVVAVRLREAARAADTVARLGGDEFVVLCDWTGAADDVHQLAVRVQHSLAEPSVVEGHELTLRASIGIRLARPGETAEHVLRDADAAMYAAKARGGGRAVVHDQRMLPAWGHEALGHEPLGHEPLGPRSGLAVDLLAAIEAAEVGVWFQPVVRLADGAFVGVEALARWRHPTRGLVPPEEFVPVATAAGMIGRLDRLALGGACRQAAAWRFGSRGLGVSVNAAVETLEDSAYVRHVTRTLHACGLAPDALTLEITERTLISDNPVLHDNLATLRADGVRLAIDDFGQEYSSFAYLRRLRVDVLKIDRSFVTGVGTVARDDALLAALVGVARALGLRTVAEGVETPVQAAALCRLGADEAQGWHFGAPAAAPLQALPRQAAVAADTLAACPPAG